MNFFQSSLSLESPRRVVLGMHLDACVDYFSRHELIPDPLSWG